MDGHAIDAAVGAAGGGATSDCDETRYDCVGETVSNFQLQSCETGEMVNFHDINSSALGTWLMMTAGWCSACSQTIPQVFDIIQGDLAGEDFDYVIVVGEDDNFQPADLSFCRDQYAPRYGQGTSNFYVDPGFETIFSNLWISRTPPARPGPLEQHVPGRLQRVHLRGRRQAGRREHRPEPAASALGSVAGSAVRAAASLGACRGALAGASLDTHVRLEYVCAQPRLSIAPPAPADPSEHT